MFPPIAPAIRLWLSRQQANGGGLARAATTQQKIVGKTPAREDHNPMHGSRNLYDQQRDQLLIPTGVIRSE